MLIEIDDMERGANDTGAEWCMKRFALRDVPQRTLEIGEGERRTTTVRA